jgi:iron only hydrogenase large subunit-like protein
MVAASILRPIFSRMEPAIDPTKLFIGLIAPCFDKKLEAVREEVRKEQAVINLVLASNEIDDFLGKFIPNIKLFYEESVKGKKYVVDCAPILLNKSLIRFDSAMPKLETFQKSIDEFTLYKGFQSDGNSNGYLNYIISTMENVESVSFKTIKNQNFKEVIVTTTTGQVELFAYVYGFKNIQNLIRRIKRKKCKYRYVEIMACPMGCVNGGGQLPLKKNEVLSVIEQSEKNREFSNFKLEIEKLEVLIEQEQKGDLSKEVLAFYHIEHIEEKDPLKIKW